MTIASIDTVARSIQKTNECLAELTAELAGEDRKQPWRIRQGYLEVLRDLLLAEEVEAAHLATQLPRLCDAFHEEWQPGRPADEVRKLRRRR